jgi:6-phosphogluconolactonase/glucosamine-6-phosphate isomerase/deaminase
MAAAAAASPAQMAPRRVERIDARIHETAAAASSAVADEIDSLIRERQAQGRRAILGLATGSTPTSVYRELIRRHRDEGLSFASCTVFNLDEYWPMRRDSLQSYARCAARAGRLRQQQKGHFAARSGSRGSACAGASPTALAPPPATN